MYDLIVIGGGPAGVTAALRARELGAHTALVERGRMGGTCTNDGCVPTRVLARAARLVRDAEQFAEYGVQVVRPIVDFEALITRTQQVVYQIQEKKQLLDHLRVTKTDVYEGVGTAQFTDPHTLIFEDGRTIQGSRFILCAGGHARKLSFPGSEHTLTHSDVWTLKHLPASVVVVGGGATGCQLASIMAAFGSKVTLVDVAPRLLLAEDQLVVDCVTQVFKERGIQIITAIEGVQRVEKSDRLHFVYSANGAEQVLETDAVLMSVGWPGNTDTLNLAAAGVNVERSYVAVDDHLQTSAPHIFAAGDITGRMMLVQSASYQARIAAENALLDTHKDVQHRLVPHGGFTEPEYAGVGLTEEQAAARHNIAVAVVPYADLDRAVIDGHMIGFCKLIVDRDTRLVIGAHIAGESAIETIQMVAAGIAGKMTIEQFADLELAYPTFAAVVGLAAREIARELKAIAVVPEWRALGKPRGAEWERASDSHIQTSNS